MTLKKEIGQPKDENDDLVMISDDNKTEISKSLINTEINIKSKNNVKCKTNKNRKPCKNLQDAIDFAFNELEAVDYNNGTRYDFHNLGTADYNNDTSKTDLVPIKFFLKQSKKWMMMRKMAYNL